MRKPDLAAAIAEHADLTKEKSGEVLNVMLDQIAQTVAKKESVTLVGFGTFEARSRAQRMGKNPQTGQEIVIPASNTVAFKPGKALKDTVNK